MTQLVRKAVDFTLKAASPGDDDRMTFSGYASCTKNLDAHGDIIAPGAFAADLPWFLENGFVGGLNHNWDQPVGAPLSAVEDARGLLCEAEVRPTAMGRDLMVLMREGPGGTRPVIRKLSIGFTVLGRQFLESADEVKAWWSSVGYEPTSADLAGCERGATLLTRVRLYEFSPVTVPANGACDVTAAKSDEGDAAPARRTFEEQLRAALGAVEDVCERALQVHAKRRADGRELPPQRRAVLDAMEEEIRATRAALAPPVAAPGPDLALRARRLALQMADLDV